MPPGARPGTRCCSSSCLRCEPHLIDGGPTAVSEARRPPCRSEPVEQRVHEVGQTGRGRRKAAAMKGAAAVEKQRSGSSATGRAPKPAPMALTVGAVLDLLDG